MNFQPYFDYFPIATSPQTTQTTQTANASISIAPTGKKTNSSLL